MVVRELLKHFIIFRLHNYQLQYLLNKKRWASDMNLEIETLHQRVSRQTET